MRPVENLEDVPGELSSPRVILMWVPHGKPVDQNLEQLLPSLEAGDVVADCGNSFWEDSKERHDRVAERGVHFLDIGTSGWLIELMGKGLKDGGIGLSSDMPPDPDRMSTYVKDTDEVKWVVKWAIDHDIPVPVTGMSQQMLMAYRDLDWPAAKSVALLRNQYGGHRIHRADEDEERR